MILLIIFAFLGGLVTILSPCILPILPIVLSGALSGGKWRPLGVVSGFILSFTFFAVFSFALAKILGITTEGLRWIAVALLVIFGVSMFVPQVQIWLEGFASRFSGMGQTRREGFWGGVILGVSLGFIWTPCVGPILASVLTLAATSQITAQLVFITLAFSLGTALPMLAIAYGGQHVLQALPALRKRSAGIQKVFGILIILTALMIAFNLDRSFQTYILTVFPQYGEGLTRLEKTDAVAKQLAELKNQEQRADTVQSYPAPNPDFEGATHWVNSPALSLKKELKGKVVLVDFWTYTCINCIRTLPYITAWYKAYKDDGLVIVGVHTPEFEFEKKTENVEKAMKKFGIEYPVVQDNDYKIWNSYQNQYWPAHYLIDRSGNVRDVHFGEGNYDETEDMIRKLLAEGGTVHGSKQVVETDQPGVRQTPETYLGYARIDRFGSPERLIHDSVATYTSPEGLPLDYFAYDGKWAVGSEMARAEKGSKLMVHFQGKHVYLVMKSTNGKPAKVGVKLNGTTVSGGDSQNGTISVLEDRLYTLLDLAVPSDGVLELEFLDGNVEVFAFTFG